jgi:hypothetical protein
MRESWVRDRVDTACEDGLSWSLFHLLLLPISFAIDLFHIAKYLILRLYRLIKASALSLCRSIRRIRTSKEPNAGGDMGQKLASCILDSHCVAWILETSLVKSIRVNALEFLATLPISPGSNPAVITHCLNILFNCVDVDSGHRAVVISGSEELANAAVTAFLHILVQLPSIDSGLLEDLRMRYINRLSQDTTFSPRCSITLPILHLCVHGTSHPEKLKFPSWEQHQLSPLTHRVVSKALIEYAERHLCFRGKVPRWILRFVLHSLSRDVPPSDVVVSDCLRIVSGDLGDATIASKR